MAFYLNILRNKVYQNTEDGGALTLDSDSLSGNTMERVVVETDFEAGVYTILTDYFWFDYPNGEWRIKKEGTNFYNEGYREGQRVGMKFSGFNSNNDPDSDFTVLYAGQDEIRLQYISGNVSNNGFLSGEDLLYLLDRFEGLIYKANMIENKENTNFLSPITNEEQVWTIKTIPNIQGVFYQLGISNNSKAGTIGDVFIKDNGPEILTIRESLRVEALRSYTVRHDTIILPYYLDGESEVDFYKGGNSLKYVLGGEFRIQYDKPETAIEFDFEGKNGDVGFYNENRNGGSNNFSVENVTYEVNGEPVNALDLAETNIMRFTVNSGVASFLNSNPIVFYHSKLPEVSVYRNQENTFEENFIYESKRVLQGFVTPGTEIIKSSSVQIINPNRIDVELEISFTADQINASDEGDEYIIALSVTSDPSVLLNDKVTLEIDRNVYSKNTDIPGLLVWDTVNIYDHKDDYDDSLPIEGSTNGLLWNEDGILIVGQFTIPPSEGGFLESLTVRLVAFNSITGESFEISSFDFDLEGLTIIAGELNINNLNSAGFNLPENSQFNFANIYTETNSVFRFELGYKIDWQSWLALADADNVFIDDALPNRGLNKKTSNYSNKQDYNIKIFSDAVVSLGGINTTYRYRSQDIVVSDYDEEPIVQDLWETCEIELFDSDDVSLGESILVGEVNTIKATFTLNGGITPPPINDVVGIIRIEPLNASGKAIDQISSLRGTYTGNPLLPYDDTNDVLVEINGQEITLTCKLSSELTSDEFKISARIDTLNPIVPIVSLAYQTAAYSTGYS